MKHLKQEFDKLSFKEVLVYGMAVVTMICGLVMLFLSLYIPPTGEIHQSVLAGFGLICVFSASLLGISIHYSNELNKFKSQILSSLDSYKNDHAENNCAD